MAEPKYDTEGTLGVNRSSSDGTTPQHTLGTTVLGAANNTFIYVYANEAIVSGTGVELGASFTASSSATGELTSIYAIASGEFGWVEKTTLVIQS
jgi:hypothetical protein